MRDQFARTSVVDFPSLAKSLEVPIQFNIR